MKEAVKRVKSFLREQDGGGTIFALYLFMVFAMLLGVALDTANAWKNRTALSAAADIGAHAGAVAIAQNKSEAQIFAQAEAAIEANLPTSTWGNVFDASTDIELAVFDIESGTFSSASSAAEANAVKVSLNRTESRGNSVGTYLLKFAGFDAFDVSARSAAIFEVTAACAATDGIFAKGRVRISSQADVGGGICLHSNDHVWLPQQNTFQLGSYVSMPDLEDCKNKCEPSANPGIVAGEAHMIFPDFGDYMVEVEMAFLGPMGSSGMKYDFFNADRDPSAWGTDIIQLGNTTALVDAGVLNSGQANLLNKGDVVNLSAAEFNSIPALPSGLVYFVSCSGSSASALGVTDSGGGKTGKGGGPKQNGGGGGGNKGLTFSSTSGLMLDSVLVTDCAIDFNDGTKVIGSLVINTLVKSSGAFKIGNDTTISDPTGNCKQAHRSTIMTRSKISVPSKFVASNVTVIADADVNVASASSKGGLSKGFAVYSSGTVDVASQHTFRSCGNEENYLVPAGRILRLVPLSDGS